MGQFQYQKAGPTTGNGTYLSLVVVLDPDDLLDFLFSHDFIIIIDFNIN